MPDAEADGLAETEADAVEVGLGVVVTAGVTVTAAAAFSSVAPDGIAAAAINAVSTPAAKIYFSFL